MTAFLRATPKDILTIDVEEWFHGHNYLPHVPVDTWDSRESRVRQGTDLCLDLLDRHGITATFFVLGWTAERHPDIVRDIVARGHEVGCHSYAHPVVFEMTESEFRDDTRRALDALSTAGVDRPAGYRSPSFSLTPPVHHYLDILQDLGFTYDSSIFPIRHPRYGQPDSARYPFRWRDRSDGLVELPMPTWRVLGQNIPFSGGGYLRLLPWPAFRILRGLARRQGQPCIVYLHPWELDDFKPEVGLSAGNRVRSQGGQDSMPVKLARLLAEGDFCTMGDYVGSLKPA